MNVTMSFFNQISPFTIRLKALSVSIILLLLAALAVAQEAKQAEEHEELPLIEVFGGYSYLHEDGANFNGWNGALEGNINKWLTLVADFDGHYATDEGTSTREHGFTFGPQVVMRGHRLVPFGFITFGGVHRSVRFAGITESENGFAMNTGGGLDFEASKWCSIRLIQIDAAYTRLSGEGSTSPRLGFGLVFPLGHKR